MPDATPPAPANGPPPAKTGPPGDGPAKKPRGKKKDRGPGNVLWYAVVAGAVLFLVLGTLDGPRGEKMPYSTFEDGVREHVLTDRNVRDLVVGRAAVTFSAPEEPADTPVARVGDELTDYRVDIYTLGDQGRNGLFELLRDGGVTYDAAGAPSEWQAALPLLLFMVVTFGLGLFLLRKVFGGGAAMSFGKSRGRLAVQEDIGVTFADAAGIEEAVDELKEIVEFLRTPQKYQALGGRIPRGVLLVGPPGTGKTLLAKAVAGEAGVPFFSLSGSDFVEMFVGVGAARVRDMFQQAAAKSPAIIFIDELDALGKARSTGGPGGHDEREQTLNALLVEMDGFGSEESVIVMGATNRPETLDPALLRPGRFDRNVTVDRPDKKGRRAILHVHAGRVKLADDVDLARIAGITPGFVGADLANLINEAALLAARAGKKAVTMVELEEAIERVVAGLEKQTRLIHADERERVSYHECGHALVACSLPHTDPVHKISIIPRGMGLGYTLHFPEDERFLTTRTELFNRICCFLGGIAAEDLIYGETSTGAQNDLQRATDIARRMVTEFGMTKSLGRVHYSDARTSFLGRQAAGEVFHAEQTLREIDLEVKRLIDTANETVAEILRLRRPLLDRMAAELLEVEVMDAAHLKRLLAEDTSGPRLSVGTKLPGSDAPEIPLPTPDEAVSAAGGIEVG